MRMTFLEPNGELNAELVRDVLGLVTEKPPDESVVRKWSKTELLIAYDWAIREHLYASDNPMIHRRPQPWFTTVDPAAPKP